MRTKCSILSFLLASVLGILAVGCGEKMPATVSVDKDLPVALYSTVQRGDTIDTVAACLLKETVHISELIRYPEDKGITMPFTFSDTLRYAQITADNLEKRIAITVNGQILSTPVVTMKITNGACSVLLDERQAEHLFPKAAVEELLSAIR